MKKSHSIKRKAVLVATGVVGVLIFSCSPLNLSNMWSDPLYDAGPMRKMVVIAVERNAILRKWWEDNFANQLGQHGVVVTPSYQIFPNDLPDTNQAVEDCRVEYDGVLIVSKLPSDTTATYIPGYVAIVPVILYDHWLKTYHTRYLGEYYPGYTEVSTVVRHQVNVWATKEGGHLVWAGTGEVINPASSKAINEEIVRSVVPELARRQIIGEAR